MASTPVDAPEVGTRPAPKHNKNSPQKEHIYSFLMNLELLDNWSPVSVDDFVSRIVIGFFPQVLFYCVYV